MSQERGFTAKHVQEFLMRLVHTNAVAAAAFAGQLLLM